MRRPSADELPESDRPKVLLLDVTDPESIALALAHLDQIDALVNTAGLGMLNVLEIADIAQVREEGLAPS